MKSLPIAMLWLASLLPAAVSAQHAPPDPQLPKVLVIGDSISMEYTPLVAELLAGKEMVVHHAGNAGPTLRGLANLSAYLGDEHWDAIHPNWGLWDMYGWKHETYDRSPEAYEQRLELLVQRLKETGAKLVWATTTPICPAAEKDSGVAIDAATEHRYLDAAARVMAKHNIRVNDLHAFMAPIRDRYALADDNVHFTPEGYRLIAEQVAREIDAALHEETAAAHPPQAAIQGTDLDDRHPEPAY